MCGIYYYYSAIRASGYDNQIPYKHRFAPLQACCRDGFYDSNSNNMDASRPQLPMHLLVRGAQLNVAATVRATMRHNLDRYGGVTTTTPCQDEETFFNMIACITIYRFHRVVRHEVTTLHVQVLAENPARDANELAIYTSMLGAVENITMRRVAELVHQEIIILRCEILAHLQAHSQLNGYPITAAGAGVGVGPLLPVAAQAPTFQFQIQAPRPFVSQTQRHPLPQSQGVAPRADQAECMHVRIGEAQNEDENENESQHAEVGVPDREHDGPTPTVARTNYDWPTAPGHLKTADKKYKVQCPECPPNAVFSFQSMLNHMRRSHRDYATYSKYCGGPPPPRVPCPVEGCDRKGENGFVRKEDVPDHLLKAHGEERLVKKTELAELKRFNLPLLKPRVSEEAKTLNDLKRRIKAAEDRLRARGKYVSRHGLDVDRVWPEDDITADESRGVAIDRLANVLRDIRIEAGRLGALLGGGLGGYAEVAIELAQVVGVAEGEESDEKVLEMDEADGETEFESQQSASAQGYEEDDIYSADA